MIFHFIVDCLMVCLVELNRLGAKIECKKLVSALINEDLPYVVVLDGDYEILIRKRNPHRRAVYLKRYSSENYFFEKNVLENVCCDYVKTNSNEEIVGDRFEKLLFHIEKVLYEVIILDIAHQLESTGEEILPNTVDSLLVRKDKLFFDANRISNCCSKTNKKICQEHLRYVKSLVDEYLKERRLVDLLRGHLVFGIIRRLISKAVFSKRRRKPHIDNDGLRSLLAAFVWVHPLSNDHKKLKNKVRGAVKEALKIRIALLSQEEV